MKPRILIAGIFHESNTFLKRRTTLKNFEEGHLIFGTEIREKYGSAYHEIGGMMEVLDEAGVEAVPLMYAAAVPSGIVEAQAADFLTGKLRELINEEGPFDGAMLAPHGAAVSEKESDMDGWWIGQVRELLGPDVPIIATLDPHANVSDAMVTSTNALVAYKTNPHIDQRETGREAARLMVRTLSGDFSPTQYFVQPEAIISIEQQRTSASPCKELYEEAGRIGRHSGVLSVSVLLGFPYADVEEMGSGFLVVTDNDRELAANLSGSLADYLWTNRADFVGAKISVEDAVSRLDNLTGPVLFLDMGDNVGGGSPGDGTFILSRLEEAGRWKSFVCIYDPESVERAAESGTGSRLSLEIGGKVDERHGRPVQAGVTVKRIANGVFQEDLPRHGGQVDFNMGKIAIVETGNGSTIMLTSLRTAPFSLKQLTSFGIDPAAFDVIVAKGVHAPIAAYEPVCNSLVQVDTDGITQADVTRLRYVNRRRPLFPFEK